MSVTAMLVWGMDVSGTRGSGIVSITADFIWMSAVCGRRGVSEVCEMCMCLARGGVCEEGGESEWMRGLGLGFTNHVRTGRLLDVCLCCGVVGGEWVGGLNQGLEGWGGAMLLSVHTLCVSFLMHAWL